MKEVNIDYKAVCEKVVEISKIAGKYIQEQARLFQRAQVEIKGTHNYVTYVDKSTEKMIVDYLRDLVKGAGFITEEDTEIKRGEVFNWIIDPLDGTTNFIHGVPLYSVSIALQEYDEIVVGVVYEPNLNECFHAWKGGPSMLNDEVIKVSPSKDFNSALLATGFPYYDYGRMEEYVEVFREMMRETAGLRRLGSAAADMAYVAAGRYEGFYEYGLYPWDVAAGIILIKQAGGDVCDFSGGNNALFGKELVCGNPAVVSEMKRILLKHFKSK
jgi:myo-inositol-1(or 4)-monophosphatase